MLRFPDVHTVVGFIGRICAGEEELCCAAEGLGVAYCVVWSDAVVGRVLCV